MRYRGYRVDIIVALALLTVLILVGGQTVYRQLLVERPLLQELRTVPGVRAVIIDNTTTGYNITLDLLPVGNLSAVYRQAIYVIQRHLNPSDFSLKLADNRTPALEDLYWQMQIYIEEAIMKGNFSTTATKLGELAAVVGVNEKFYVDEECVYLELRQDATYLYAVRQRGQPQKEAAAL